MDVENPDGEVGDENTNLDDDVDYAVGLGLLKMVGRHKTHPFAEGLPVVVYNQIVRAACEAATMAAMRAVRSGAAANPSRHVHIPPDHPISDETESETGVLEHFACMYAHTLGSCRVMPSLQLHRGRKRSLVLTRTNLWTCVVSPYIKVTTDVTQEAMRKFLESKGVLASKDYLPDEPEGRLVDAFEEYGIVGPSPIAPRVCLTQTFKGKWNKEVVEMLTIEFVSAVKQGTYKPVQHSWLQMAEEKVRQRCQRKLYRTQYICRTHGKRSRANSDKINRMYQRRQEVCLHQHIE
jgi:hypothetical protein